MKPIHERVADIEATLINFKSEIEATLINFKTEIDSKLLNFKSEIDFYQSQFSISQNFENIIKLVVQKLSEQNVIANTEYSKQLQTVTERFSAIQSQIMNATNEMNNLKSSYPTVELPISEQWMILDCPLKLKIPRSCIGSSVLWISLYQYLEEFIPAERVFNDDTFKYIYLKSIKLSHYSMLTPEFDNGVELIVATGYELNNLIEDDINVSEQIVEPESNNESESESNSTEPQTELESNNESESNSTEPETESESENESQNNQTQNEL